MFDNILNSDKIPTLGGKYGYFKVTLSYPMNNFFLIKLK